MIPFVDLKSQHQALKGELEQAVLGVLDSCQFTLGSEVEAFEQEFSNYCSSIYGVGVNSGTSALHLALLAAGVGPGDEVVTVPFTFVATVAAIHYTGAKTVFVDIDPGTYTMDPVALEAVLTPNTKAIIPVHLYGQPADMDPILELAAHHKITVIEDAAQAHGAEYKGRRVGSLGDMACFSFYPGKNLGACGEAGIIVTDNPEYNRTLRMLRDWGAEKKYEHILKGYNYRMEGIQGAVLRVKLRYIEQWTEERRSVANKYNKHFMGSSLVTPKEWDQVRHVYHIYAIRASNRTKWQAALSAKNIQTGIHYPTPVHLLRAYDDLGYKAGDFPHAELAAEQELSLPMFPGLSDAQCESVARSVLELIDQ